MAFGDEPGGRRTIGLREIALAKWAGKPKDPSRQKLQFVIEAASADALKRMGGEMLPDGRRVIELSKKKIDMIQSAQRNKEKNGEALIRLMAEGKIK